MSLNSMVTALYEDLQQGRPVNHNSFTGKGTYSLTFDKSYSKFIIFMNAVSPNHITDVKLNDVSIGLHFNVVGSDQGYCLHMAVHNIDVKDGDVLTIYCNAGNSGYCGCVVVY